VSRRAAPRTNITDSETRGLRFGQVAEEYERVRPSYPAALIDGAIARAGIGREETVVEIGCGTGKLTRDLVARGLRVEAVEPDPALIAVARRIGPEGSVRFHAARFEDAELPEAGFPAAFAATSFHWVDPSVGWHKVASLLRPGGIFALLGHCGGMRGALNDELSSVWRRVAPETSDWEPVDDETLWRGAAERMGNVSELWGWLCFHELGAAEAAELFEDVRLSREPYERELPAEDYLARMRTSNYYLHLTSEKQLALDEGLTAVLDAHGGVYPSKGDATLVTARRAG
jgi:SAM-dependent methyltransferase